MDNLPVKDIEAQAKKAIAKRKSLEGGKKNLAVKVKDFNSSVKSKGGY